MPIYDHNGTSNYEVKTPFDNDLTVQYPSSKVYDHEGTANHEVFSAGQPIFSNGDQVVAITGGWQGMIWSGYHTKFEVTSTMHAWSTNDTYDTGPAACFRTANLLVDVSAYSKVEIKFKHVYAGGYPDKSSISVAIRKNNDSALSEKMTFPIEPSKFGQVITCTLDISSFVGAWQFLVIAEAKGIMPSDFEIYEVTLIE